MKTKTDRDLCAEVLAGDTAAFDRLAARYARQIGRIAEERFRRNDMSADLMDAVRHAMSTRDYLVLAEWFESSTDSISGLIEKLGTESPLLDSQS